MKRTVALNLKNVEFSFLIDLYKKTRLITVSFTCDKCDGHGDKCSCLTGRISEQILESSDLNAYVLTVEETEFLKESLKKFQELLE